MLDDIDRRLLRLLQDDPSLGNNELAELTGMTAPAVWRRLEKLREAKVIAGQVAVIDWRALGYEVEVSLRITLDKTAPRAFEDFAAAARQVPEVIEIQTFLGRVDLRLSVIARSLRDYQAIYHDRLLNLPHILEIESLMTIAQIKNDESLPL
ncbi:Lrp/AsnC family transcriptional regulator [Ketogulonicigenium vulgare]|uniref:Transcriptional regulator, AsnC family protein n=1 Tax=Ketogulonicigenium vulgare (strain WSH-001) TaxID=759362 RepID=F9Y3A8_KETVW|nr:Lrp/AsnC family transcriptional regulator [Ketogulonicigenium vulgare]ADO42145.1 transcriptional regulator, AsnC family [Ketogulonicigenium vulgare Y25]AEM40349.1 Transcriptional regulator, AsnC family protein [Ketogulonicigenium vulgare WSH-001]ALJ80542.1 AsnC family transcriptional regulator [Ketogulonicigenium vulgare]ANW33363.1 AsnC family transcriptional regulator [Ketogulonicigenium vulgare]AOZ54062.1 transcriptional regulator, AsnC family [Ketogulonicigenium vulgare]